jgi:hypothetical protein
MHKARTFFVNRITGGGYALLARESGGKGKVVIKEGDKHRPLQALANALNAVFDAKAMPFGSR